MDLTTVKVIERILDYHGVSLCLVGELVLNYYNVPRVCHRHLAFSAQLAFSRHATRTKALITLPSITTGWTLPQQAIVIYPDSFHGLNPLKKTLLQPPCDDDQFHISKEVAHLNRKDIASLPLPRLAPFLTGLAQRFLASKDDFAMIAVEQLVDGMNLDQDWVTINLAASDPALLNLVMKRVASKQSRIDYVSDNSIRRLNDAAIALYRVLNRQNIAFGIFGGYAIGTIGGVRESKDIDCLASVSKDQILQLLDRKEGFQAVPQTRQDYAAFLWSDKADRKLQSRQCARPHSVAGYGYYTQS
ncbi:hypothetical protein L249_6186 [Ophiocordyceps polyrhachis-furcata BCC 54312]|uniref:Uncharacterized protein n=1 Tax=Ophiocordyceps polyrhachis-furcata BCC 54312 TaxID=1330021 RepID=A0A367LJ28_9HYPO|nr:hypothetical protein L249_6186 [Ophiocordyceps polyrhachis-furcata BCC 54312]